MGISKVKLFSILIQYYDDMKLKNKERMNWAKYGLGAVFFVLGFIITSAGYSYYGDIKYGIGSENYAQIYIFAVAIGCLVVSGPALIAVLAMSPTYTNVSYYRVGILHFLCGFFLTGIGIFLDYFSS